MGLLRWLFGERKATEKAQKIRFDFLIYDEGEKIEPNKWFQKASWKNKNFVGYKGSWNADWKYSDEGKVKIAGLSRGSRSEDFIHLAREEDFKIFLENEPENPVNKNARKVMASATIDGEILTKHVGYLPDEIATKYAGKEQHEILCSKLRGFYQYFGVRSNYKALEVAYEYAVKAWRYWLSRRSSNGLVLFADLERSHPLPMPKIVHGF